MKYIPGTVFTTCKTQIKGSVKNYFSSDTTYILKNIYKNGDTFEYTFTDGIKEFKIPNLSISQGDTMIGYLINGEVLVQESYWDRERSD